MSRASCCAARATRGGDHESRAGERSWRGGRAAGGGGGRAHRAAASATQRSGLLHGQRTAQPLVPAERAAWSSWATTAAESAAPERSVWSLGVDEVGTAAERGRGTGRTILSGAAAGSSSASTPGLVGVCQDRGWYRSGGLWLVAQAPLVFVLSAVCPSACPMLGGTVSLAVFDCHTCMYYIMGCIIDTRIRTVSYRRVQCCALS